MNNLYTNEMIVYGCILYRSMLFSEGPPLEQFDFDRAVKSWSNLKQRRILSL